MYKWLVDIDIQLFICHPVRKLLVLINQSSYLIYFCYNFVHRAKEINTKIRNKIEDTIFACSDLFYFSSFISKKKKATAATATEKVVIVEEKLNRVFIDENLGISDKSMIVESLLEIPTKWRSQTSYKSLLMFALWQM